MTDAQQQAPEAQSDTLLELAAQIRHALENRGTSPIDAIAIVQNFTDTIAEIAVAMETIVDDDHGLCGEWQKIRDHLAGAVSGLGWIANGWL